MALSWSEWKQRNAEKQKKGNVSPLDFLNPETEYVSEDTAKKRMDICLDCPKLIRITHQCRECGCLMNIKTNLLHASCPLSKW